MPTRFLAFFDEYGDHSMKNIDRDVSLFVISKMIVERAAKRLKCFPMNNKKAAPDKSRNRFPTENSQSCQEVSNPFANLSISPVPALYSQCAVVLGNIKILL
jgi:hypothetical protein